MSSTALLDCWYLVGTSRDLAPGKLIERTVAGRRLVLARRADGSAFALHGLCPHRQMPFVHGRVENDEVVCAYHGWRFAGDGQCQRIPALIDEEASLAARLRVPTWALVETDGLLWAFLAAADRSAAATPPMPFGVDERRQPMLVREVAVPLDLDQANFGLLDPAHVAYVHRSWYWRKSAETRVKEKRFEPCALGWRMARHKPSANSLAMHVLGKDTTTEIRFQVPGVRTEIIRFGNKQIVSMTAHTPIDDGHTMFRHLIWLPKGVRFWLARPFLRRFGRAFIEQDVTAFRRLAEAGPDPGPRILVGEVDHQYRWYRQVKDAYAAASDKTTVSAVLDKTTLRWRT